MRILFVTPYIPSPLRVRPWQFLRHLSVRGHEVTLVVLTRPGSRRDALSEVGQWCRDVVVVPVSSAGAARSCLRSLAGSSRSTWRSSPRARRGGPSHV